jgi:hypothetical protein
MRLRRRYIMRRAFCPGRSQRLIERLNGFESGRYLSWPGIAAKAAWSALRLRCDLPFWKYLAFRVGYHYERTFGAISAPPAGFAVLDASRSIL